MSICSAPPWSVACLSTLSSRMRSLETSCAHPSFLAASKQQLPQLRLLYRKQSPPRLSPSRTAPSSLESTMTRPCQAQRVRLCHLSARSICCKHLAPHTAAMPASPAPAPSLGPGSLCLPDHPFITNSRLLYLPQGLSCPTGLSSQPSVTSPRPQDSSHGIGQQVLVLHKDVHVVGKSNTDGHCNGTGTYCCLSLPASLCKGRNRQQQALFGHVRVWLMP